MIEDGRDILIVGISGGKGIDPTAAKKLGQALASMEDIVLYTGAGDGGPQVVAEAYFKASGRKTHGLSPCSSEDKHMKMGFPTIEGMEIEYTGTGIARNGLAVERIDVLIVLPGELGTLSEVVMAVEMGRLVLAFSSNLAEQIHQTIRMWKPGKDTASVVKEFNTPEELSFHLKRAARATHNDW